MTREWFIVYGRDKGDRRYADCIGNVLDKEKENIVLRLWMEKEKAYNKSLYVHSVKAE